MNLSLSNPSSIILLFALSLVSLLLAAEEHADMALEHAHAAANSKDSKSVAAHAAEALKHTESAKANADEDAAKHLEKSESHLNSAIQNANWHNTHSAIDNARDGLKHLEEATGK